MNSSNVLRATCCACHDGSIIDGSSFSGLFTRVYQAPFGVRCSAPSVDQAKSASKHALFCSSIVQGDGKRRVEGMERPHAKQVWPASTAQPAEHGLRARGRRPRGLDARRLGWSGGRNADAAGRGDPCSRIRRRAYPCRRHDHAGSRQGQDPHWAALDLCARGPTVWGL